MDSQLPDNLSSLKSMGLRELLKARSLSCGGRKEEMIDRLLTFEAEQKKKVENGECENEPEDKTEIGIEYSRVSSDSTSKRTDTSPSKKKDSTSNKAATSPEFRKKGYESQTGIKSGRDSNTSKSNAKKTRKGNDETRVSLSRSPSPAMRSGKKTNNHDQNRDRECDRDRDYDRNRDRDHARDDNEEIDRLDANKSRNLRTSKDVQSNKDGDDGNCKNHSGNDSNNRKTIETSGGKTIPKIEWSGGSSGVALQMEQLDEYEKAVRRAKKFGGEVPSKEQFLKDRKPNEISEGSVSRICPQAEPESKVEKYDDLIEKIFSNAKIFTAEHARKMNREFFNIFDFALAERHEAWIERLVHTVDAAAAEEFKFDASTIRRPSALLFSRLTSAAKKEGLQIPFSKLRGPAPVAPEKSLYAKGFSDQRWSNSEGIVSRRGRARFFGHDDRAGVRDPSPPLEGAAEANAKWHRGRDRREMEVKRMRVRDYERNLGRRNVRSKSGEREAFPTDRFDKNRRQRDRGERFRGDRERDFRDLRDRERDRAELPGALKREVENFVRENRLDERVRDTLLHRSNPREVNNLLQDCYLSKLDRSDNPSKEFMLRMKELSRAPTIGVNRMGRKRRSRSNDKGMIGRRRSPSEKRHRRHSRPRSYSRD